MIKTVYASKKGADFLISPNFKLSEMQCRDGTDKVLYSDKLLEKLEELRAYGGFSIHINSGYRTSSYNKQIGGASKSQHTKGTAADIFVKKDGKVVDSRKICCLCQTLGFKGIGYISGKAVHVDMRESGLYRGDERKGYGGNVGNNFYAYFNITPQEIISMKVNTKEEEDMTQEQFNKMMNTYLSQQAKLPPSDWSAKAREFVENNKIFNGDAAGLRYKSSCTREELAQVLYGMAVYFEENGSDKSLVDAIKAISIPLEEIAKK